MQYFFILGRNPTLSVAEITNVLQVETNNLQIKKISKEVLILETRDKINLAKLQEKLGGTIKVGKILTEIDFDSDQISKLSYSYIRNKFVVRSHQKVYFGFSIYKLAEEAHLTNLGKRIKDAALEMKKKLKACDVSSRWVTSRQRALSSVVVKENRLLERGAEFVFLVGSSKILFGRTLTVQAFKEYSFRDFSRPARPIEKGMMPPKLAKIMINLSQAPEGARILDPFCGSGTILQEVARLGYQHLIGTDTSDEAVENTKKNLEWLAEKSKISAESGSAPLAGQAGGKNKIPKTQIKNVKIFRSDVREISKKIAPHSIDAIVTEPYLGPLKISNFKFQISNLSDLYLSAFKEFKKILKPDGRVVIILPIFRVGRRLHFLPILDKIKKMGWRLEIPIPDYLLKNPVIKITSRGSMIYSRPGQKVLREIFIFKNEN